MDESKSEKRNGSMMEHFWKYSITLAVISLIIGFYGQTESQWFNSFMTQVAGYTDLHKSAMVSTSAIFGTIFFLLWGAISDNYRSKYGRRIPFVMLGFFLTSIFMILFGLSKNFWWLWLCDGVLIGITSNMFHMGSRTLIPDIFPEDERGKANTVIQMGNYLGTALIWVLAIVFLPKGGGSYTYEQHMIIFTICSILLFIGIFITFFFLKEPVVKTPKRNWISDLKLMFNRDEMSHHKGFLKLFLASLFLIMANNAYTPWLLELLQQFSYNSEQLVFVGIIFALAFPSAIYISGKFTDKIGRKKVVNLCLMILILGCILVGASNFYIYIAVFGLAILLGYTTALDIAVNTWTQDLLPDDARAKFLGIINIGRAAGQVPGVVIAAYFSETFGVLSIFYASAIYLLIAIILFRFVPETLNKDIVEKLHHDNNIQK